MARVDTAVPMKKAIALHWWAVKVWWKEAPKVFVSTGLMTLVETITPFVTVWCSARVVDELAGKRDPSTLWRWVILTVAATALLGILGSLLKRWQSLERDMADEYQSRMMSNKMLDMDYCQAESTETRDVLYEMRYHQMGNVFGFLNVFDYHFRMIVAGAVSILGAVALCASLFTQRVPGGPLTVLNHPLCGAAVVALLALGIFLAQRARVKANEVFNELWPASNLFNRHYNALAALMSVRERRSDVRIYEQQAAEINHLRNTSPYRKGGPGARLMPRRAGGYQALSAVVGEALIGVAYAFACLKALGGAFGVGMVTQYVGAFTALTGGLTGLMLLVADLPLNAQFLDAIQRFLNIPNDAYQGSLTTEKRSDREYTVEFRDVSFKYPGSDTWVLRHVNMKFRIGSRLAIVGENGSGKTTFIKLLCRLYDATEGTILLNGIDIRKYRMDEYMALFSVVFQDFKLTDRSVGANVGCGEKYDREKALSALTDAGFAERLTTLPKGLDTFLCTTFDKEGVELSGGEAQKVAIARALYKDAPFLILDEPTAALDPMAEAEIYGRLGDIVGDKTAIFISHRLSSCKFCDEIAVFDEGQIVQQGSHDALLDDEGGKYYKLWTAQAQYYTE